MFSETIRRHLGLTAVELDPWAFVTGFGRPKDRRSTWRLAAGQESLAPQNAPGIRMTTDERKLHAVDPPHQFASTGHDGRDEMHVLWTDPSVRGRGLATEAASAVLE
jgi:hypothetical protein